MKLRENYEKTALALAVLSALGLGSAIGLNAGKVERDFQAVSCEPAGVPILTGSERLEQVSSELDRPGSRWGPGDDRVGRLFTGPTAYVLRGGDGAIDLSDPASPPVHPPIPNRWWLQHGIDPGFADSPRRDADWDGFSNLEEFEAGSNPADSKSHPPLIGKLRVVRLEERSILLTYSTDDCIGAPTPKSRFGFRYQDTARARNSTGPVVPAGNGAASTFFPKPPAQLRFELKAVAMQGGVKTATVIDRQPNKNGRQYQIQKGARNGIIIKDFKVKLVLDAIGRGKMPIEVEENETFSLPFDAQPVAKRFQFKEVRQGGRGAEVVIEFREKGGLREHLLPVPQE